MNRRIVPLLAYLIGCGSPDSSPLPSEAHLGVTRERFESAASVLVDFAIDGALQSSTADPAEVRALIESQLLYTIGILNEERSVGRFERLELSDVSVTADGQGSFAVAYRAKLPVAWGIPQTPGTYALALPARVDVSSQHAFAMKYGSTCVAEGFADVAAQAMFLHYRPQREGCRLDPADIVTSTATVSTSSENTTGKYPEYQRIWEDGTLDAVAFFSREFPGEPPPDNFDGGIRAYADFLAAVDADLAARQPDAAKRSSTTLSETVARRTAVLPDGRNVRIDARLVTPELADDSGFDAWYDALTPKADLVLYGGHAGQGRNVAALFGKGTFAPMKYTTFVVNGCDTFAYVDKQLASRRALVNPDDVSGTKYMDLVSNVMAGYFSTTDETALVFLRAVLDAREAASTPRTYRQIFADVDPAQVIVVTGEEDNTFHPSMFATAVEPPVSPGGASPGPVAEPANTPRDDASGIASGERGCGVAPGRSPPAGAAVLGIVVAALSMGRRRSRGVDSGTASPYLSLPWKARTATRR